MKALEILKHYFKKDENEYCRIVGVSENYLVEAIAELEALEQELQTIHTVSVELEKSRQKCIDYIEQLENKSCDGCKYYKPQTNLSACPISEYCSRGIND